MESTLRSINYITYRVLDRTSTQYRYLHIYEFFIVSAHLHRVNDLKYKKRSTLLSILILVRLVRHIMANGYQKDFDLFSTATEPLVNILSKSLRGRCPLTRLGVFGLNRFHDIRLCDPRQTRADTGLLNHFVIYHHLSYPWANKLCNAMRAGDQDGTKQTLFKSDEPIKAEKWLNKQAKNILGKRSSREKTDRQDMMNRSLT